MKTSESILKIAPALLSAKKAFKPALKTAENPHFKSKYVDLQSVVEATEEALAINGLVLLQSPETSGEDKMVSVTSRLIHISGEWIEGTISLPSGTQNRYDAQTVGSAITYARRYSYMGILGIAPEDDDGATASGNHAVKVMPQQKKAPPTPAEMAAVVYGDAYEGDEPLFDENGDLIEAKASVEHREQKQAAQTDDSIPSTRQAAGKRISAAQGKRFVAIAQQNGKNWKQIGAAFKAIGIERAEEIPVDQYDIFIEWAGGKNERRA